LFRHLFNRGSSAPEKTIVPEHNVLERWGTLQGLGAKGKPDLTLTFPEKASNIAQIWNDKLPKHS
jgi:hypothetical protein